VSTSHSLSEELLTLTVTVPKSGIQICFLRGPKILLGVVPLLCNNREKENALLGKGSVNTFPQKFYPGYC
jgi:hypothetical protein